MIYTRIDTYSVMLRDVSLKKIADKLDIALDDVFFKKGYFKSDTKYGDRFVYVSNNIRFECDFKEYLSLATDDNDILTNYKFSSIRLYIGSLGIDYLLSKSDKIFSTYGGDLIIAFSDYSFWLDICESFNVTRCDFAFDFINMLSSNFLKLRKIMANADFDDKLTDSGRLLNCTKEGLSYQYRGGKERTIYLGSTSADKMLRIYDKKFQLTLKGVFEKEKVPKDILDKELDVDSWFRCEFQTRDDFATNVLFSCGGDMSCILGVFEKNFNVRTADGKYITPLHRIFIDAKHTQLYKMQNILSLQTEIVKAEKYLEASSMIKMKLWCLKHGCTEKQKKWFNDCTLRRMNGTPNAVSRFLAKERSVFINAAHEENFDILPDGSIKNDDVGVVLKVGDDGAFYFIYDFVVPTGPYSSGG